MLANRQGLLKDKRAFLWLSFTTLVVLSVPAIAMLFTNEVQWKVGDFIVMGALVFGLGSLFIVVTRKNTRLNRRLLSALFVVVFILIWLELAVGVFAGIGS